MIGKKVVHHLMMSAKDAHYVGALVNGARIVMGVAGLLGGANLELDAVAILEES